jgi:hypothetical protein
MKREIVKLAKDTVKFLDLDDVGDLTKQDIQFIAEVLEIDVLEVQDVLFNSEF